MNGRWWIDEIEQMDGDRRWWIDGIKQTDNDKRWTKRN